MNSILERPTLAALRHGALREMLANACSTARIGRQQTRDWEDLETYIADDNEGRVAVARFVGGACIVAAFSDDPCRDYDISLAVSQVPPELGEAAEEIVELPIFDGLTAIFWASEGAMTSGEPWHETYSYGGDIFANEFLPDSDWIATCGVGDYDFSEDLACRIVEVSARPPVGGATRLHPEDVESMFPAGPFAAQALAELYSCGLYKEKA